VTITLGRAEKYDILALSPKGNLLKISVKTTQKDDALYFPLSNKDESGESDDFYYAFVKLYNFAKEPDFWIIPSKVVCPILKSTHAHYLETPGKKQQAHNDSNMRILRIEATVNQLPGYPDAWNEEVKRYYKNLDQLATL